MFILVYNVPRCDTNCKRLIRNNFYFCYNKFSFEPKGVNIMYISLRTAKIVYIILYAGAILGIVCVSHSERFSDKDKHFLNGVFFAMFIFASILAAVFNLIPSE